MTSSTIDEAKEECSNDPTCTMFYKHCANDDYRKCNVSSVIRSSACGSIVYTKGYKRLSPYLASYPCYYIIVLPTAW